MFKQIRLVINDQSIVILPVFWIAANLRGYMKQCYHKACDDDTHITDKRMEFAAKIARALISWVDTMAPYPKTTATASECWALCRWS